jgi:hypothetical protein
MFRTAFTPLYIERYQFSGDGFVRSSWGAKIYPLRVCSVFRLTARQPARAEGPKLGESASLRAGLAALARPGRRVDALRGQILAGKNTHGNKISQYI